MALTTSADLLASVDKLSADKQKQLFNYLDYKLASKEVAGGNAALREAWDGLMDALGYAGSYRPRMQDVLRQLGQKRGQAALMQVDSFIARSVSAALRRPAKIALRALVWRCLLELLRERGERSVDAPTALKNAHLIGQAVDQQFPGYADARLLHFVVPAAR